MDTTTSNEQQQQAPSFHPAEDRRLSIHKLTHSSSLPSFESLSPTMHNGRPAPHHPIPNVLRPTPLDHRPDLTGRNTRWRRDSLPSIANLDFPPSSASSVATEPQPFPSNLRRHSTPDTPPPHHHHEHLLRSQQPDSPYSRTPELRESHKLAERRRRKEMKELFDDLLNVLPIDKGIKTSKWEILSKAVDYINDLQRREEMFMREKELLLRDKASLQSSIPRPDGC
ncbi:helix-loop-helix DNA-binding protein [Lichtheimia hyalospora FSU 10163]|nr:helix-loop-helix DNA-binding protein [Lichtheimia hyalospora FSU 10163]